ncbi:cupredoxin domain-containing protein [Candidatus Wolfebacteria bacterium]|nr:cupredoxin domain-containing protein [Candidatus Wolfebacteria bacterium]
MKKAILIGTAAVIIVVIAAFLIFKNRVEAPIPSFVSTLTRLSTGTSTGLSTDTSTTSVSSSQTSLPQGELIQGQTDVSIANFFFNPESLRVKTGTIIRFINEDSVSHSIKSASFNSPILKNGDRFELKIDQRGTYDYSCGIHPTMTGKITVE